MKKYSYGVIIIILFIYTVFSVMQPDKITVQQIVSVTNSFCMNDTSLCDEILVSSGYPFRHGDSICVIYFNVTNKRYENHSQWIRICDELIENDTEIN